MFTIGFDLDLTLIDTRQRILAAATAAFADLGHTIEDAQLLPYMGEPIGDVAGRLIAGLDVDRFTAAYRGHYDSDGTPVPVLPGAHELLDAIDGAGGQAVVVSAKQQAAAERAVADAGLRVAAVVGDHFGAQKGDALREFPDVRAYLGDHPEDASAAKHAGCAFIGLTTGEFAAEALTEAGAAHVVDDLIRAIVLVV